ncbi:Pyroglutamyl-peptidase 1 [Lonchura striata]|uniref:Pyroglutamyl-peptidase I n=1 Tax=Lonchura striata TaxID=40157 RepID=A0A218UBZ9_9PASE|nr:Pyroglutamyl-peptidase 1 [Lonchura striata domestica]
MEKPRRAVVVTGFGPFGEHAVNASWIAVQELEKLGLRDDVDLHVYEVPVEYQTVQRLIPALWKKHSPQKCGHNVGYKGLDNCRFCPGSQCCVEGGPECIDSIIDMDAVCRRVSALGLDVTVTISKDAGRYLCDFTYYTSLYQSRGRRVSPDSEGFLPIPEGFLVIPGWFLLIPEGFLLIPERFLLIPEGFLLVPEGFLLIPEGFLLIPEGFPLIPEGFLLVPEGFLLIPEEFLLIPEGFPLIPEGFLPIPEGFLPIPEGFVLGASREWVLTWIRGRFLTWTPPPGPGNCSPPSAG